MHISALFGHTQSMGHPPPSPLLTSPPLRSLFTHTATIHTSETQTIIDIPYKYIFTYNYCPATTCSCSHSHFEMVWHPHGIGPNKPVIRVPVPMEVATFTHPTPSDWAIAKSVPPSHPTALVQCHCGQLVPISGNQVSRSFPLHHTFSSFISQFISLSFPFPRQLFSHFIFS